MDNKEAIRRIKDHIRVHKIGEYPHIKIAEALSLAISALATENNVGSKWIPVTERLPEHCVTVLSYDGRHYRNVKTDSYDHCFECWLSDMDNILDESTVTHWMPLPEPPKEESK